MNAIKETLDYEVKRLTDDTVADIAALHTAVYGIKPAAGLFAKKYDTTFTGVSNTGFLAYNNNGLPVAFYGVIPCFLRSGDKIILAAQSADTMTHPGYRNKGLFIELATRTFELCRTLGISLVFGFPNQNSLPGFVNKLGWQMTERMDCFRIPVTLPPWRRLLNKLPFAKGLVNDMRQKELKKWTVDGIGLTDSIGQDGFSGVLRDNDFRNYKTYNDLYLISVNGALLWLKAKQEVLIGD